MHMIVPTHYHLMKDIAISFVREHQFRTGCHRAGRADENITALRKGRGPRFCVLNEQTVRIIPHSKLIS
jgi:hypothetical protein